jgi:hypothetical protein
MTVGAPLMNRIGFASAIVFFLSGCSSSYETARSGIAPVLQVKDVKASINDQRAIINGLAYDAGFAPGSEANWYEATTYGFNYVDDQCRVYFSELFSAEKDLQAAKSGVSALGQTTSAILSVTGASKLSMGVVAQAFGLSSSLLDVTGSSFLYKLPAAPTKEFVGNLQNAYRDAVARRKKDISPPDVYYHVQRYLDLCLPATIEGRITKYIGAAQAFPDDARASPSGAFGINVESSQAEPRVQIIPDARTQIRPPQKMTTTTRNASGQVETAISASELIAIQKALCVTADADWGAKGSETRVRIKEYLTRLDASRLNQEDPEQLTIWGRTRLHELVDDGSKKCGLPAAGGN